MQPTTQRLNRIPRLPARPTFSICRRLQTHLRRWVLQKRIKRMQAQAERIRRYLRHDALALAAHGLTLQTSGLAFMRRRMTLQQAHGQLIVRLSLALTALDALAEVQA